MFYHELNHGRKDADGLRPTAAREDTLTESPSSDDESMSVAASPYWGDSTAAASTSGFSPFVAFCFSVNYVVGTGFLTIPYAFSEGGLILSAIVIVSVGLLADIAKDYLLEAMARAEAMLDNRMHWIKRNPGDEAKQDLVYSPVMFMSNTPNEKRPPESQRETSDLLQAAASYNYDAANSGRMSSKPNTPFYDRASSFQGTASSMPGTPRMGSLPGTPMASNPGTPKQQLKGRHLMRRQHHKYHVRHRKFEVNTLVRVFVGKTGVRVYTGFICLYIACTLWAYTSVFASAMAQAAPIFAGGDTDTNYLIYALIFSGMVVPMSCMELDEQVVVQVTMTGARFVMFFLMLGTSSQAAKDAANVNDGTQEASIQEVAMFRFQGINTMLPIMVFSHIYHHSIPGLAHPVADKRKLGGIFQSTTIFGTVAYAMLGLVVASAFGTGVEQSSNLMWKHFTGGTATVAVDSDGNEIVSIAWWAKAISIYVLCFPALDVVSAFPLNAITLGNNMMGSYYGSKIHEVEVGMRISFSQLLKVLELLANQKDMIFSLHDSMIDGFALSFAC